MVILWIGLLLNNLINNKEIYKVYHKHIMDDSEKIGSIKIYKKKMKNKIIRVYLRFENDLDEAINIFKKLGGVKIENTIENYHFYAYVYMDKNNIIHAKPYPYYSYDPQIIDLSEFEIKYKNYLLTA